MLLHVAAWLRQGRKVGSHEVRQAETPTIGALFRGGSGRAVMCNRDARACTWAPRQATL